MRTTRRLTNAAALVLVLLAGSTPVDACPICFGSDSSPLLDAARLGVLTMALVTVGVLGAFARWFMRLRALASKGGER